MNHLTRDELIALLRAARKSSERDWIMILLGYSHGFRASEIIGLTPENVRDGFVTVQRLKGSKRTTQALLDRPQEPLLSERAAIEALVRKTDARKRLFPISRMQFWRIIQKHGKSAGLPEHKCHPHILKHTTGMAMIKKGNRVYPSVSRASKHCEYRSVS